LPIYRRAESRAQDRYGAASNGVAIAEGLGTPLANGGVAHSSGKKHRVTLRVALRLHPVDARASSWRVGVEGCIHRRTKSSDSPARTILDRHAAALAHHWRTGVRRVADQKNAAVAPVWQFERLDRGVMDLFVTLEGREKGANRSSERLVALAEPREPSFKT
jgi:hypothetical protein